MPLTFYSDIFEQSRYFTGRGLFLSRTGERQSWTAFAGTTSRDYSFAFFRSFQSDQRTAALLLERKLSRAISVQSFDAVQNAKLTSIGSLRLQLGEGLQISGAGGVGANRG
ncbi:MAG: hypothetical protein AB7O65_12735, partial [Candidatus Korobacteraceae bacterium]